MFRVSRKAITKQIAAICLFQPLSNFSSDFKYKNQHFYILKERSHSEADGEGSGESGAQVMFTSNRDVWDQWGCFWCLAWAESPHQWVIMLKMFNHVTIKAIKIEHFQPTQMLESYILDSIFWEQMKRRCSGVTMQRRTKTSVSHSICV